jgi:hypothetical protein
LAPSLTVGLPPRFVHAIANYSGIPSFAPDAQEFFVEWYSDLRRDIRSNAYDHPAIEDHVAKYAKLMPAPALIFELVNAANVAFCRF